jgi:hypothetical protein
MESPIKQQYKIVPGFKQAVAQYAYTAAGLFSTLIRGFESTVYLDWNSLTISEVAD